MKQVWILNHYALEPGSPGGTRHYYIAEKLPDYKWYASIIAASVELNSGRQRLGKRESHRLEIHNNIPFLWINVPTYEGNAGVSRMLNMLWYAFKVLIPKMTGGLTRPDLIIGSSVHPFAAWSGALIAKRYKIPFVFEVRDLWPQTLIDMGRINEKSLIARGLRILERWLYRQATRIVVLLPNADEYIVLQGISKNKLVWIPNGVDLSTFPNSYSFKQNSKETFDLMYFGAHGQANELDNILHAMNLVAKKYPQKAIQLRLVGDGPSKKSLIRLAQVMGLKNVGFENPVPKKEIPKLASQADAFVFNLIDAPVFRYGISSNKLFDFMAASRPILFCCNSSNNPVEDAKAGITVPPGDPAALSEAIIRLSQLPDTERENMGYRGRQYVKKNHDFTILAQRLAVTMDDCLQKSK